MDTAARSTRIFRILSRLGLTLAVLAGLITFPCTVTAASCPSTLVVTSNADSGPGTLRQAILEICANGTITFDRSLSGATITLTSGVLNITKNITIDGSTLTDQITISGGNTSGIFYNSQSLNLKSLKITQGNYDFGGGVRNSGSLTVTNSTFSGNSSTNGGAILISGGGTATVTNSTFSGNTAFYGGAIYNIGTLLVRNSTFSGNSVSDIGSGISNSGTLTLLNSTFYGNSGLYTIMNHDNMTVANTILAGTGGTGVDCYNIGFITSASKNNLLQNASGCATSAPITGMDPLLDALADNGGPTRTFALQTGSPAIDAGDYATCLTVEDGKDQRSVSREDALSVCDIGAFEVGSYLTPEVSSSNPSMGDTLTTSPTTVTVVFNKDVDADSATKPANYLLVSPGGNGSFQTNDCLTGLSGDDTQITVNSVNYNSTTFTATLNINGGTKLTNGSYQLYVCGTTSIIDTVTTKLNNGTDDTRVDFTVSAAGGGTGGTTGRGSSANSTLPATGFAPGIVTALPDQTARFSGLNIRLEIPRIGVNAPVVGVGDDRDVSWLGRDAGWLNGSAFPTWAGNSVITGHVWDADNNPGLFADLKTLKYGDTVLVHAFKSVYTYEVRESQLVPPTDTHSVFRHEEQPWISLLTCEDFNPDTSSYTGRRLVRAVLVNVTAE